MRSHGFCTTGSMDAMQATDRIDLPSPAVLVSDGAILVSDGAILDRLAWQPPYTAAAAELESVVTSHVRSARPAILLSPAARFR